MSDKLYYEVPVVGQSYRFGDWKLYAKHNDNEIFGFFGSYRWLSNFYNSPVYYEGLLYQNSEAAYQAAKLKPLYRIDFIQISPVDAKKNWKNYGKDSLLDASGEAWDSRKYDVMSIILMDKFYRNIALRQNLLDTKNKELCEANHWHDNFFGYCICKKCNTIGQNKLGIILTKIRNYWK